MLDPSAQKSFQERFTAVRTLDREDLLSDRERTRMTIKDTGTNAFFELSGSTYCVREINTYEETSDDFKSKKGYFVYELTCLCIESGKTIHFEWEYDDELEVAMTLDRYAFRQLRKETP